MKKINPNILDSVFHAYDIRGRTPEELNTDFYEILGKAFVAYLSASKIAVGHDIRSDSKDFFNAFVKGARSLGCEIVNIGEIATEMLYFEVGRDDSYDGGATITASHNPTGWNGCKMVGKKASALSSDQGLNEIKKLMLGNKFPNDLPPGNKNSKDIYPDFKKEILGFMEGRTGDGQKLIVDAGNGIGGKVFKYIFNNVGFEVEEMYFEPDGTFPYHVPNPLEEENVVEIKKKINEGAYDLGIAIDGDADRVFFLDNQSRNPSGVYTGSILAKHFAKKEKNAKIIHDPRITWPMTKELKKNNAIPIEHRPGHSFFKQKMKETNAIFAAELSSHFFYRDFYYADSGMVTIAVMLKLLIDGMDFEKELDYYYDKYPISGEINFEVEDVNGLLEKIRDKYKEGEMRQVDGLSVEFEDWRFNLRSSNTQPVVRLNLEAKEKNLIVEKYGDIKSIIGKEPLNTPSLEELRN